MTCYGRHLFLLKGSCDSRVQLEDKVIECDAAKSEASEFSNQLERQKALMASARDEALAQSKAAKAAESVSERLRLDLSRVAAQLEEVDKLKGQLREVREEVTSKEGAVRRAVDEKNASRKDAIMCQGQMVELRSMLEAQEKSTKAAQEGKDKEMAAHEKTKGRLEALKERLEGLEAAVKEAEAKFTRSQVDLASVRTDAEKAKMQLQMVREKDAAKVCGGCGCPGTVSCACFRCDRHARIHYISAHTRIACAAHACAGRVDEGWGGGRGTLILFSCSRSLSLSCFAAAGRQDHLPGSRDRKPHKADDAA